MIPQPRKYQKEGIDKVSAKIRDGFTRILFQLATGGGKTFTFAFLIQRYLRSFDKKVLVLVHRDELLKQTVATFAEIGIKADPIYKKKKYRNYDATVYVAMVETANNRLKESKYWFGDIGLIVPDEAHIGNFRKVYEHFEDVHIVGFTATPISAKKSMPMKGEFEDIVTTINIPDLIKMGSLVNNITYHYKNIDRSKLKKRGDDFQNADMSKKFGAKRNVNNTVIAYEKHGNGGKTVVFNCNIEHSKLVTEAFLKKGYNARHLDSKATDEERSEILTWLKQTPDAILNNVGILTTGFDEITLRNIIVNRSTMSLSLWLQMTGRGARPINDTVIEKKQKEYSYKLLKKDKFTIIDLGGNALAHGDWSAVRDWEQLFHFPEKSNGGGVAPVRDCEGCGAIIFAGTRKCEYCGFVKEEKEIVYDFIAPEFVKYTDKSINVDKIIERNNEYNDYRAIHVIKSKIVSKFKKYHDEKHITEAQIDVIKEAYLLKVKEWCKGKGKRFNQWHREVPVEWLMEEIERNYNILKTA